MVKTNKINNLIANNPFRLLGLTANCSDDEIRQSIISSNPKKSFDLSNFRLLSSTEKNTDNKAETAANTLLSYQTERAKWAILWFVVDNNNDKKSMALIRQNKIEEAIDKLSHGKATSNLHNITLLYILSGKLHHAVQTAWQLYTKHLDEERQLLNISDKSISLSHLLLDFLVDNADISKLVYAVADYDEWSYYVVQQGNATIYNLINNEILKFNEIPVKSYSERLQGAEQLFNNTIEQIKNLKLLYTIDEDNSNTYKLTSDTVANEILQAAINYANNSGGYDAPLKSISVMEKAAEIAVSQIVRARCAYNIKTIQKHINGLPPADIKEQVDKITKSIKRTSLSERRIDDAEYLLKKTLPILSSIKNKNNGYFYTRLLNKVCAESITCIKTEIESINNDPIANLEQESGNNTKLFESVKSAMSLSDTIGHLNMTYELRNGAYAQNRTYLKNIMKKYCISFGHQSISNEDIVVVAIAIVIFFLFIIAFANIIS